MDWTSAARLLLAAFLFAACGGDDDPAVDASTEPDARPPRGTISLTWRLVSGGDDVACGDAGAQLVDIEMVRQGEAAGESDVVNCSAGEATTREVNVGTYDLQLDLLDSGGVTLLAEPVTQLGIDVNEDSDTRIGEVVFEIP